MRRRGAQLAAQLDTDRKSIRLAFMRLKRDHEFKATRMSFSCCSACGLAELEEQGVKEKDRFVWFHRQDAESFDDEGEITQRGARLMLRWGGGPKAAEAICEALGQLGLVFRWDGADSSCFEVLGRRERLQVAVHGESLRQADGAGPAWARRLDQVPADKTEEARVDMARRNAPGGGSKPGQATAGKRDQPIGGAPTDQPLEQRGEEPGV